MRQLTSGDVIYVYGNLADCDYTVRLCVRMDESINGKILETALERTSRRYPYLCVRLLKNDSEYYYEDNTAPVCLFNTADRITLGTKEANYHVWAVCYKDDFIYLDFYHGICDGTEVTQMLSGSL